MVFWTIYLRRRFGDLRHIQLSTHAWPCHSSFIAPKREHAVVGPRAIT